MVEARFLPVGEFQTLDKICMFFCDELLSMLHVFFLLQ